MNTDQPETDEEPIDVFVLCTNPQDATHLAQQLSPHGYRVTLFTDIPELFGTIRSGKPNILIIDAASTEPEGYALCNELKKDYDLWQVPVLLITRTSDLSDLLKVLDSNADNFIARPYNESDLFPLIETIVAERVERPDPEKVKTRFKIRHDNQDYVILADRRKLLNFLISSYELAVSRTQELGQVQGDLQDLRDEIEIRVKNRTQALSGEVERLETLVKEHARTLAQKEKELHDLDARFNALRKESEEREATISRQAASLTKAAEELDQTRLQYTVSEERIRTLISEKEALKRSLEEEIDTLRIARDELKVELDTAKRAHSDALDQITSHEVRHADLTSEKEQTEATIRSLTLELDDLKSALNSQKGRAAAAEQELQSIKKAKADTEQDLQKKVNELLNTVKEQAIELEKQKGALKTETDRAAALGKQVQTLSQEKEKGEAALGAERKSLREERDTLQNKFNETTASLGAERQRTATLMQELKGISETNAKLKEDLHIISRRLEIAETACEEEKQLRFISEKNAKEAISAKDEAEKSCQKMYAGLHEDKKTYSEELALANRELDSVKAARKKLEDELAATVIAKVQSEKFAQSLSSELEQVRAYAETERKERQSLEERLRKEQQAKDQTELSLRAVSQEKESDKNALATNVKALTAELELVKSRAETERKERQSLEERLRKEQQAKDQTEQNLRAVSREKESEKNALAANVKALSEKVDAETRKKQALEQQLSALIKQQSEMKEALQTCAKERESLALNRKDGEMKLHEIESRLAKTQEELTLAKNRLQSATQAPPAPVASHAIIIKGPELPQIIERENHSLSVVDSGHHDIVFVPPEPAISPAAGEDDEVPSPEIRSVEDLFEDDPVAGTGAPPAAASSGMTQPPTGRREDTSEQEIPEQESPGESASEEPDEFGDQIPPVTASPETGAGEIAAGDAGSEGEPEGPTTNATGTLSDYGAGYVPRGIPFDRQQWFDLVKWVHSTPSLSHEEKLRIVRLGRLLQKGRRLTHKQDEQVAELVTLAYTRGYKPK